MVPERIDEIGAAIARAIATLDKLIEKDLASVRRDPDPTRARTGEEALDATRKAADAVRERLAAGPASTSRNDATLNETNRSPA